MKKALAVILVLAAMGALSFLGWKFYGSSDLTPSATSTPATTTPILSGLIISEPTGANPAVSSPLKISGYVNGDGWFGFEGQVGSVKLVDEIGNVLAQKPLTAITEWMTTTVKFETSLEFNNLSAQTGKLIFRNENPAGMPEMEKEFVLPVKFSAPAETVKLKAYFANDNLDPEATCEKVFSVTREVPKTAAVARAALEELLKGPTEAEKAGGYITTINPGVVIQSLVISATGTAYVDFSEKLQEAVGGSCRVAMIHWQIVETLKQFSTVKNVVVSINGNTEDILQP
ncbi:MAG: GerMN domain-containing protein [Patescibacteria group bacterium]